ncbi:MAG TPA: recombinase family protein, partial [Candidatus Competibacteraceae bacterium]|nr:recombinase family protein [Candidatus Competibacteraceae bacterium]
MLSDPYRLEQEYRRRLEGPSVEAQATTLAELTAQREKVRRASARLIDSYADGLIEKGEFEPRIQRLKHR